MPPKEFGVLSFLARPKVQSRSYVGNPKGPCTSMVCLGLTGAPISLLWLYVCTIDVLGPFGLGIWDHNTRNIAFRLGGSRLGKGDHNVSNVEFEW